MLIAAHFGCEWRTVNTTIRQVVKGLRLTFGVLDMYKSMCVRVSHIFTNTEYISRIFTAIKSFSTNTEYISRIFAAIKSYYQDYLSVHTQSKRTSYSLI